MIEFSFDKYKIAIQLSEPPGIYDMWLKNASYFDLDDLNREGTAVYIGIAEDAFWYDNIIAFRSDPIDYAGFHPGFLLAAETDTLFIGAGSIIKIYDLKNHKKTFQKEVSMGFWGWHRDGDYVMMLGELELAAYTLTGTELWSTNVEPPWGHYIDNDVVVLDIMGNISYLDLKTGEPVARGS